MRQKILQRGFTLVELIMVIVIMGVIGGVVSVFMKAPIDAYFASARRAELTDVADTTARRISRDLHKALPNSVRKPGATCVEFIPTKTGGRYRTATPGDTLDFTEPRVADGSFNMLGKNSVLPVDQKIVGGAAGVGDLVVVNNQGSGAVSDAYASNNTARVTGLGEETAAPIETPINIVNTIFPQPSIGNRFYVVPAGEQVVGYVCNDNGTNTSGTGTGTLRRYIATLPGANSCVLPVAGSNNVTSVSTMATKVSSCSFAINASNVLVSMVLQLTDSNETVSLYHQVHVNNTP